MYACARNRGYQLSLWLNVDAANVGYRSELALLAHSLHYNLLLTLGACARVTVVVLCVCE